MKMLQAGPVTASQNAAFIPTVRKSSFPKCDPGSSILSSFGHNYKSQTKLKRDISDAQYDAPNWSRSLFRAGAPISAIRSIQVLLEKCPKNAVYGRKCNFLACYVRLLLMIKAVCMTYV